MKKKYKMENLDCANCAAKMEDQIRKIPGVNAVSMNFLTQRLTIDADDNRFDEILAEAQKCCDRVDKGCRILVK